VFDLIGGVLPGRLAYGITLMTYVVSLRRRLRIARPEVIYTRELWLLPFLPRRYRTAWEAHDAPRRIGRLVRRAVSRPDSIVVTSDALAETVRRIRPGARIMVERNGVDLEAFERLPDRVSARRSLGLPADRKISLYTGQLLAWKGIATLLEASKLLPDDHQVVIVGGSDDDIRAWQAKVPGNKALFLGRRPHAEIPTFLAAADVCVLPNTAEDRESSTYTSPIKLFEYLASGCPIVASSLPSIREIVGEGEALLVTPDDPAALADTIVACSVEGEQGRERAARGRRLVRERYGWASRAVRILDSIATVRPATDRDLNH
jgi:glycosyltransferase involved in cell wall biosynthesis